MPESTKARRKDILQRPDRGSLSSFSFSHKSPGCSWLALGDSSAGEDSASIWPVVFRAGACQGLQTIRRPMQCKRFGLPKDDR